MSGKAFAKTFLLFLSLWQVNNVQAQFAVSGQIRTRTEFRDGQGSPAMRDTVPAFFTSQRTRLNFGFTSNRFNVYASVQDVRVWGQDASSVNRTTTDVFDGFLLHEAWGEISLVDTGKVIKYFTLKIGRQEHVYDDVRLLAIWTGFSKHDVTTRQFLNSITTDGPLIWVQPLTKMQKGSQTTSTTVCLQDIRRAPMV